jgi:hypothetical protein
MANAAAAQERNRLKKVEGVNCAMDPPGKRACIIRLARRGQERNDQLAVPHLISSPRLARRM